MFLPQLGYFFGVSSATGDLADNHDIISIKSYEVDATNLNIEVPSISSDEIVPSAQQKGAKPTFSMSEPFFSSRTYKIFTFMALFLLVVAIGAVVCYIWFQRARNNKNKRLF